MRALALIALLCSLSTAVAAEKDKVYKWVDKNGVVHYENKPHEEGAEPAKLPPLQTYKGGTPPDLSKYAAPPAAGQAPAGAGGAVQILSPAAEETFREAEHTVPVSVAVASGLQEGAQLMYYLDGAVNGGPTPSTNFALKNVERGTHTVTVALVDASGQEVGRSQSVTFYMKPPAAKHK